MNTQPFRSLTLAVVLACGANLIALPGTLEAHPTGPAMNAQGPGPLALPPGERRAQRALRVAADPALAAMVQMRMIERIHLRNQQPEAAERMYRSVLERTQDTRLRNFVNMRLARVVSWQPRNLDETLVELQRGLDENLSKIK